MRLTPIPFLIGPNDPSHNANSRSQPSLADPGTPFYSTNGGYPVRRELIEPFACGMQNFLSHRKVGHKKNGLVYRIHLIKSLIWRSLGLSRQSRQEGSKEAVSRLFTAYTGANRFWVNWASPGCVYTPSVLRCRLHDESKGSEHGSVETLHN